MNLFTPILEKPRTFMFRGFTFVEKPQKTIIIPERAVIEYCGIQRSGKSTLMTLDALRMCLPPYDYKPDEIYANYNINIDGIHCINNEQMLIVLTKAREEKWRHKIFLIDECSQPPLFYARNTRDVSQTMLVTSLWQMPKLDCNCFYSSNVGNSVDIQMRDATWYIVLPHYKKGITREEDIIEFCVAHAYECWFSDFTFKHSHIIQRYFDSFQPII